MANSLYGAYDDYTWLFVIATVLSYFTGFGLGANDVANSFGSSVGTKALTIAQACIVASVCEFSGALGIGANNTSTIKSGITNVSYFAATPDLFAYGMFSVMCASAFWDNLSYNLELHVSSTHTTVFGILGMTFALKGSGAVIWYQYQNTFPFCTGMTPIFIGWVASPAFAAVLVFIIFGFIRGVILRSEHSFDRGFYLLPFFSFCTTFLVVLFIIETGYQQGSFYVSDGLTLGLSFGIAAVVGLITLFLIMPVLRRWVLEEEETRERSKQDAEALGEKGLSDVDLIKPPEWWVGLTDKAGVFYETKAGQMLFNNPVAKKLGNGVNVNIHEAVTDLTSVGSVWDQAEVFDWKTEALFRYLQVFSACVMSFAHGANDVANAAGPYAAIYYVWQNRVVPPSKSPVPKWIYVIAGVGIISGLAIFGYKIMRVVGVKIAKLTNARGFSAEISTATVVLVAARYGLPVSTTQTVFGAIVMVGLFEGIWGINWRMLGKTIMGWFLTPFVAAFIAAGFASFGAFSPNKISADKIVTIKGILLTETVNMIRQLNASNHQAAVFNTTLNSTLASAYSQWKIFNGSTEGYIQADYLAALQQSTFKIYNSTLVK